MRRILPEDAAEAYRVTGIDPMVMSCRNCPVGAVYAAECEIQDPTWMSREKVIDWAVAELGVLYARGFMSGFDGDRCDPDEELLLWRLGFKDGRACAKAILGVDYGSA